MKNVFFLFLFNFFLFLFSCKESKKKDTATTNTHTTDAYDPQRGEGKFSEVKLDDKLDPTMITKGEKVSEMKCFSCHRLTDQRLVGPGWKGVTKRKSPEWIMNFITNPDPMIDKDPDLMAQLELCLVRMPNQGISDSEARDILEFMRSNDSKMQ